jgi:hypothetical protein
MELNKNNTLIILDWDDTLFPTSWVNKNDIDIININKISYVKYFEKIDISLVKLFNNLINFGDVLIITNALLNWINISSKILPNSYNLFKNNKNIKFISARGEYSSVTSNINDWKKLAFINELKKKTRSKKINNIISIGDAEYEYNALVNLHYDDKDRLLKSVKFIRYPDNYNIYEQINILNNSIYNICTFKGHLDLQIKNKK